MKITASQLRRIIKEEVKRVVAESSGSGIEEKILDIVGFGEEEDYETTARIVSKYLRLKSTVSRSQRADGGMSAVLDPVEIEEELIEDLKGSKWADGTRPSLGKIASVARQIVVEFGLDPSH